MLLFLVVYVVDYFVEVLLSISKTNFSLSSFLITSLSLLFDENLPLPW